jgi:hypothetical protein
VSEFRPFVARERRLPGKAYLTLAAGLAGVVFTIVGAHGSVRDSVGGVLVFAVVALVGGLFVGRGLLGGVLLTVDTDGISVGGHPSERAGWAEVASVLTYKSATGDGEFVDGVTVELIDGRVLQTYLNDSPGYGARRLADAIAVVAPTVPVVDGPEPGVAGQFPQLAWVHWLRGKVLAYQNRKP